MNLRQRLDEIRQLEQKATPGPWETEGSAADYWHIRMPTKGSGNTKENAKLCAAMRNAIGPLLEVVEQQHRALSDSLMVLSGEELSKGALINALSSARAALSLMDKEVK